MLDEIPLHLDREGKKEKEDGERGWGVGGDYSRGVIILNIFIKGGRLLREAIHRGTAIIRGNRVTLYHPTGLSLFVQATL